MSDSSAAQFVSRTLRALELLALAPQTQADIARELEVHRRTARRLLARLEDEGYVRQAPMGQQVTFEPTAQLITLGKRVADRLDRVETGKRLVNQAAAPHVRSWCLTFSDQQGVWLGEPPATAAQRSSRIGLPADRREALHAQADGKVFLSDNSPLLGDVLNHDLIAYTPSTVTTRADLLLDLAQVRSRGYALERGEHDPSFVAVAAGARDLTGHVNACVTAFVDDEENVDVTSDLVRSLAGSFSRELGGTAPGAIGHGRL